MTSNVVSNLIMFDFILNINIGKKKRDILLNQIKRMRVLIPLITLSEYIFY